MSDVNLSISTEVVKPIIEAKIQAAIVAALGDNKSMVESVVGMVLQMKVDKDCKRSTYDYENKYSFIEALCMKEIAEATRTAIKEYFQNHSELVKNAMKKYLSRNTDTIAESFIKQLIRTSGDSTYNHYTVEIKPKEKE